MSLYAKLYIDSPKVIDEYINILYIKWIIQQFLNSIVYLWSFYLKYIKQIVEFLPASYSILIQGCDLWAKK